MSGDLDPDDWEEFRRIGRQALDDAIEFLRDVRDRPVWREAPAEVRARFEAPLPRESRELAAVLADFNSNIKPFAVGNTHPLFMGWVHGAGTPAGVIAAMLAAA